MNETISELTALGTAILFGSVLSVYLCRVYDMRADHRSVQRWAFSAQDLGGFSYRQLMLVSLLSLFLELLMIRWISSEIRVFAYFKNFVLIACFLGFGLGCYLCRRKINLLVMVLPLAAIVLLIKVPWQGMRTAIANLPTYLGVFTEVHIWGVPTLPLNWLTLGKFLVAMLFVVSQFALIALSFIPMGQLVGWYLENARSGIRAYSVNVLASLAGILLYTLVCFLNQPPPTWFALAATVTLLLFWRVPVLRWSAVATFAFCLGMVSLGSGGNSTSHWSPYQKLTVTPWEESGETLSYLITTNDSWYQQILNLSPGFVASHPELFAEVPVEWNAYNVPYRFYPQPQSVLVLGSGMGNDVAAALRNGAGRVVAVEIDPLILRLGQRLHFERPYSSPRVVQVVDDARSYVQNSPERFDLIVFSLLDSHTTSSHYSNIRIDNYVYTREALGAAKRLLEPDGILIIKFHVETPWIGGRLKGLLKHVFGRPPLQFQGAYGHTTSGRFFIAGSEQRIQQAMQNPELADFVARQAAFETEPATLTTDDWPYFYQQEPGLPASVIAISVVLVFLCLWLMSQTGTRVRAIRWHFFFLGAGFLLLEAQIISKMALLFGTTWIVNSIVIAWLLLLIVVANWLVEKKPQLSTHVAYAGVLGSLLVSYAIPLERFFFAGVWMKALSASLVLCLPVFFASIVFIKSFADCGFQGEALGSNLMGALVGGLLESLSFWTGISSLLLLAGLLYLASFLSLRERRLSAI